MDNKKPSGPVLKRDENNVLDRADADAQIQRLMKTLITEERAFQKDLTFRNARGNKRDVMMFITIVHRNSIDGKIILGEDESKGFESWSDRDPYKYKAFDFIEVPFMAKDYPMKKTAIGAVLMQCFKLCCNYLIRMGVIDSV